MIRNQSPITVLLAEDHAIVREGLRLLLQTQTGIAVIGEAKTGRQAVELAKELHPDVIVMDIAMPLLNGLEGFSRHSRKPKYSFSLHTVRTPTWNR